MQLIEAYIYLIGEFQNKKTIRTMRDTLMPFVNFYGVSTPVSEITTLMIKQYIQSLKRGEVPSLSASNPDSTKQFVEANSPWTIHKHIKAIKRFFNEMVAVEVLARSPAAKVKNPRPTKKNRREKALTPAQFERIARVCFGNKRNYAIIRFLWDTGCRAIGVQNLEIGDVDFRENRAIVTEKFEKTYSVWFSEETAQALKEWLISRPFCQHNRFFSSKRKPYKPMTSDAVQQVCYRAGKDAGLKEPIGSHSFRYAFGYAMSDAGVSPTIAATAMGHEDASITMEHYYPHDTRRAEQAARNIHQRREARKLPPVPLRQKQA